MNNTSDKQPPLAEPSGSAPAVGDYAPAIPLFGLEDEMLFRRQFAIQFLASYAATHLGDLCANGLHGSLERLPVEDAEYLSGTAWRHWCETMPMKQNAQGQP